MASREPITNYIEKGSGLHNAVRDAGHWLWAEGDLWFASNAAVVQAIINSFDELAYRKAQRIKRLDEAAIERIGLLAFIQAGTLTTVTGTQVANFIASAANNYRTIRQTINNAPSIAEVEAVVLTSGWPANP